MSAVVTLLTSLGLTDATDFDAVERGFMERVHGIVSAASESYDEAQVKAQEQELKTLFQQFFDYAMQWAAHDVKAQMKIPGRPKDHPDATRLKAEARNVLRGLQGNITNFAVAYMHINRFTTLVRDGIRNDKSKALDISGRKIKWTADAGVMMARYEKRKAELLDYKLRFGTARDLLASMENDWVVVTKSLEALYGPVEAEGMERSLRASLRIGDMKRARTVAKAALEGKLRFGAERPDAVRQVLDQTLTRLVNFYDQHQSDLQDEEKRLFLRAAELGLVMEAQAQEIRKINGFVMKYSMPYMEFKLGTLSHLRDKMMVIGSLENLMTLYRKMLSGLIRPLADMGAVREYESTVINRTRYLQNNFFGEVPTIIRESAKVVEEFRVLQRDYHKNVAQAEIEGVDLGDEDGADDNTSATGSTPTPQSAASSIAAS
ncbi:hypothetical protein [Micavibrio aeruginosavorus]|uniref:hypothetical protein n=1 Tax=Micavibrio aeruginosavorus TaxID=349221 RepID=UPI003F4AC758